MLKNYLNDIQEVQNFATKRKHARYLYDFDVFSAIFSLINFNLRYKNRNIILLPAD